MSERKKLADLTPDECRARVRQQSDNLEWALGLQTCKNARAQWRRITGLGNDEFAAFFASDKPWAEFAAQAGLLTPESLGLPSDEEVIAEVTGQARTALLVKVDQEVSDTKDEIDRLRDEVEHCRIDLEKAEDEAHRIGMKVLALDEAGKRIPDKLAKEDELAQVTKDRRRRVYDTTDARLKQATRKLAELQDPGNIEQRVATRARLATVKERNMAGKTTAKEQGFPEVYLADNGNFKVGMDAAAKGDMVSAICGQVKKDARYDFTTEAGLALAAKLIKARGWQSFVEKRKAKIEADAAKAEKAKADKAAAKKSAPAKATSTTQVKADPKPKSTPRKRTTRKVGS